MFYYNYIFFNIKKNLFINLEIAFLFIIFLDQMRFSLRSFTRLTSNFLTDFSNIVTVNPVGNDHRSTVFLTHVKWVTGKSQLEKYFSRYGKVQDVLLFFVNSFNEIF